MREIGTADLFCMEVINLCDGSRLGYPSALTFQPEDGHITALIVPVGSGFFSFGKNGSYRIPWCRIECIGEDTILVRLTDAELADCLSAKGNCRRK